MLKRLLLRDVVIVPELEIEFDSGFSALTGETGAGKSILIDALQLALGNRADAHIVREGAQRAEICAEFTLGSQQETLLQSWLEQAGFELHDHLLLRRTIDTQGKSRAWINGSAATISQLRELGEQLVEIHGQHAWQSLTRPAAIRSLLDNYAGLDIQPLQAAWQSWQQTQRQLDDARHRQAECEQERERLIWQINELEKLSPQPDEWSSLNSEHTRLSHAQSILDAAQEALIALSEADYSASRLTNQAIDALEKVAPYDAELSNTLTVLHEAQAQLQDAIHSIQAHLRHTELEPDRLATLDQRLSLWMSLARRLRKPPEELTATLQQWHQTLQDLEAATDLAALEKQVRQQRHAFDQLAAHISTARQAAAPQLAQAVTAAIQTLGMPGGQFTIQLNQLDEPQAFGQENIEFLVAGHAGSSPRPVAKVASGGELSRLALAIAVCGRPTPSLSASSPTPDQTIATLIFDEIDTGIGGTVAETVGQLLKRLGQDYQVLAVTHLPQVAACADQHFVVRKQALAGTTASHISRVTAQARTEEIARLLGGQITPASLAHATEMLHKQNTPTLSRQFKKG